MPRGGARPGAGRKPGITNLRTPELQAKAKFISKMNGSSDPTPMDVMLENMLFYHRTAGELLATIYSLPTATRTEAEDAQFRALALLADHMKMRDKAGEAANALAKYVHRPMAPLPVAPAETGQKPPEPAKQIELIPVHPAADAAFKRAAEGLPPAKRDKL